MTVLYPESVPALGTTKVKSTPAIADTDAPSLATEINAATAKDLSLTFYSWNPTVNVNSGTEPARLGTKNQFPQEGLAQYQPIEVSYPFDPQAEDADPANQGLAALAEGTEVYVVVRKGIDIETDFAVGDKVEVWKVRCGRQTRTTTGEAEFAVHSVTQMLYPMVEEGYGTVAA